MKDKVFKILTIVNTVLIIILFVLVGIPALSQNVSTQIQENREEKNKDNRPTEFIGLWIDKQTTKAFLLNTNSCKEGLYNNSKFEETLGISEIKDWYVYKKGNNDYIVFDYEDWKNEYIYKFNNNIIELYSINKNELIYTLEKVDNAEM